MKIKKINRMNINIIAKKKETTVRSIVEELIEEYVEKNSDLL